MKENKVSILLPVYNTNQSHLMQCLHSIVSQTFQDWELVIADNGSTDSKTLEVIKNVSRDSKVKVVNVPQEKDKKNLSIALNRGLLECSNELVARMDSDDVMFPKRLQKQLDYFNENWEDVDILGTQLITSEEGDLENAYANVEQGNVPDRIYKRFHKEIIGAHEYKTSTHFCNHPTVMFKKSVIIDLGGYRDTPNYIPEDFCLWAKALKRGYKIRNLQDVLLWYREEAIGLSLTDSQRPEWYQAIAESRNNLFDFERYI